MTYSFAALQNPFLFIFLSNHPLRERPHRQTHTYSAKYRVRLQGPNGNPSAMRPPQSLKMLTHHSWDSLFSAWKHVNARCHLSS